MRLTSGSSSVATVASDASGSGSNVNLRDLGRQPTKPRGMFGMTFNSMFQDEIETETWKQEQRRPAVISCPTTGVRITKKGIAHEVVNNEEQWQEMKKQMREKGAVNNMTLRQNLNGLLQDRVKSIPKDHARSQQAADRAKTSITDFATSLVLGDDTDSHSLSSGASKRRTRSVGRRHSPMPAPVGSSNNGGTPHHHVVTPTTKRRSSGGNSGGAGGGEQAANIVRRAGRRLSSTATAALGSLNAERAESTSESLERRFSGNSNGYSRRSSGESLASGRGSIGSIVSNYVANCSGGDLRGIKEYDELGLESVSDLGESTNRFDLVM